MIAKRLTLYVYCTEGAPDCPDNIIEYLETKPAINSYKCPICLLPILFSDFNKAKQSRAEIETGHLNPNAEYIHTPDNVCFVHRQCNIAQGERSISEFLEWIEGILKRNKEGVA